MCYYKYNILLISYIYILTLLCERNIYIYKEICSIWENKTYNVLDLVSIGEMLCVCSFDEGVILNGVLWGARIDDDCTNSQQGGWGFIPPSLS